MAAASRFVGIKGLRLLKYGRATPLNRAATPLNKAATPLNREFSTHQFSNISREHVLKSIIRHNGQRHISLASVAHSKVVDFKLSDIGEGIREVSVKEWFVKEGDKVAQFDNICEVQSDKASVTITSRFDGTIVKLYHQVDDTALVGQALLDIEIDEDSAETEASDDAKAESSESDSDSGSSSDEDELVGGAKFLATPAVRNLARQNNVKLNDITASGKKGRILKDDIFAYMDSLAAPKVPLIQSIAKPPTPPQTPSPPPSPLPLISTSIEAPKDCTEAISGMRKAMVKSMTAANNVPHFSFCDEINMNNLVGLKSLFKEVAQKYGVKFSYTSVFIKAASLALSSFPLLNSSVDEECKTITYKGSHNIGVAIDSGRGLVVPNIKNVSGLSVLEVAQELERLNKLAAIEKLGVADLTGGTFTLSNVGMIGGTYTKPVIFVPQLVIGALGSIIKQPRYNADDQVYAAHLMNVSWSADHRVIDGATLAHFSNLWKSFLEQPASLLLHLR